MHDLLYDLRYALRGLRRAPWFTLAAVLTLAVGIGANTAIFSVLDRLLVRTLPVTNPGRLVHVVVDRGGGRVNVNLSYPMFTQLRQRDLFAGVLAFSEMNLAVTERGGATHLAGRAVAGGYFQTLGIRPAAGRFFAGDEGQVGAPKAVAVLGFRHWTSAFGGDTAVIGREIRLEGRPFTVIGVAPERFDGLVRGERVDIWIPIAAATQISDIGDYIEQPRTTWLNVFARLAPGVTRDGGQAALTASDAGRIEAGLQRSTEAVVLRDGSDGLAWQTRWVGKPLVVMMATVAVLLLIACANVAALFLVRSMSRRRELAVRIAVGGSRGRLLRQLLVESLVLAGLGGAAGLILAVWASGALAGYRMPGGDALQFATGIDGRVLGFAALVSLATTLLFGLLPAVRASRQNVLPVLKGETARSRVGRHPLGLRDALVVAQVALSVVLLVGAALLGQTLRNLQRVDVGFDPHGVLMASMDVSGRRFTTDRLTAFYDELLARARALPGAEHATLATTVWPNPGGEKWGGLDLEGFTGSANDVSFDVNRVATDYFTALRVPILAGRAFEERDRGSQLVAVVNETMAERYWPDQPPIGQRIFVTPDHSRFIEIVGVARDGKYRDLREGARATLYLPIAQVPRQFATLLVRTTGSPLALAEPVRKAVAALDPDLPLFNVRTLETHVALARARERLAAGVVSLFGAVALGLAALGLYGLLAAAVGQRTREIGVRVALGARPFDIARMLLRHAALLVTAGAVVGVIGGAAGARFLRELLFEVGSTDPASLGAAIAVLVAVGLVAAWLPAGKAARLDPVEALRHE